MFKYNHQPRETFIRIKESEIHPLVIDTSRSLRLKQETTDYLPQGNTWRTFSPTMVPRRPWSKIFFKDLCG